MIVMAGHMCIFHRWATLREIYPERYRHQLGLLMSPRSWRVPEEYFPYALDNGRYPVWEKGTQWNADSYLRLLEKAQGVRHKPLWAAVPDVVADPQATLDWWNDWCDTVASFGYKLAFVCQDGHTPDDVPESAYCCFIGGTKKWKEENAHKFKGVREELHIGRVNWITQLRWAERIGADSVDGSGWARGDRKMLEHLKNFIEGEQDVFQ